MTNEGNKQCNRGDKRLAVFIASYFLSSSFNMCIKTLLRIPERYWSLISYLFEGIMILCLVCALPTLFRRVGKNFILTEVVFVALYAISLLMGYAELSLLFNAFFWTVGVCIPLGFCTVAVRSKEYVFDVLYKICIVEYPLLGITLLLAHNKAGYDMSTSYALVLPVIMFLFHFFKFKKKGALLAAAVGTLVILLFGARGPLICIAFFVVFYVSSVMNKGKFRAGLLLSGIGAVFLLFFVGRYALTILKGVLAEKQIYSRTIDILLSGSFSGSSERGELFEYYFMLAKQKPLLGWGLQGGWLEKGNGPHNALLEIVLALGFILGTLVSLYLIFLLVKVFLLREGIEKDILFILLSYNITMYVVMGNWLEKPIFFMFIIWCAYAKRCRRGQHMQSELITKIKGA